MAALDDRIRSWIAAQMECPYCHVRDVTELDMLLYIHLLHVHPIRFGIQCDFLCDVQAVVDMTTYEGLRTEDQLAMAGMQSPMNFEPTVKTSVEEGDVSDSLQHDSVRSGSRSRGRSRKHRKLSPRRQSTSKHLVSPFRDQCGRVYGMLMCFKHQRLVHIPCEFMSTKNHCHHGSRCHFAHPLCEQNIRCTQVDCPFDHTDRVKFCLRCPYQQRRSVRCFE